MTDVIDKVVGQEESEAATTMTSQSELTTATTMETEKAGSPPEPSNNIHMNKMAALQTLARHPQEAIFDIDDKVPARRSGFFIFAKRYSTKDLMRWSKKSIPEDTLTSELSSGNSIIGAKCFEEIQRIMGDRRQSGTQKKASVQRIQYILDQGLFHVPLRDELYLQLIKQLTENPSCESRLAGWRILCCFSTTFPPSITMDKWTLDWIQKWSIGGCGKDLEGGEKIKTMAAYVAKKLRRLCQVGPKGHLPSLGEIERAMIAPFSPSPFGETLEDIMTHDELVDESGMYPRILIFLSEAILKLGGCNTEGIFRVPGDIDGVTALKLSIENGDYNLTDEIRDPSIPASLLKLWLRELAEPLIPSQFYDQCIRSPPDAPEQAITILDQLPQVNLLVTKYLIKFLQVIGDPRYQPVTKMNVSNLAMVFAPNFLRCPSDNPLTILANSKLEQMYIKTLINYLEE